MNVTFTLCKWGVNVYPYHRERSADASSKVVIALHASLRCLLPYFRELMGRSTVRREPQPDREVELFSSARLSSGFCYYVLDPTVHTANPAALGSLSHAVTNRLSMFARSRVFPMPELEARHEGGGGGPSSACSDRTPHDAT